MLNKYYILTCMALLELAQAQRPSFAGSRPPDGLNQKDKYQGTKNTAVENNAGVAIASRFGEDTVPQQSQIVTLAYGAVQKPPMGVPLVFPISNSAEPTSVVNRFAEPEPAAPTSTIASGSASTPSVIFSSSSSSNVNPMPSGNALPIDAHGDRNLVNHISQLPADNQPFWFLNYQAIEALRNNSKPNVGALETRGSFFAG
ncbi:CG14567 [Drosophila busckii]|uniref:CG14567 n=1 Tax=Drosophila busckii TaxID=30019 RepID=A0A0M5JBS4_DROBS|nr:uncharacterized protein LOC108598946 [Drosophila busckii]ALC45231.1 CG14567 [Drosophila busckii]